MISKTATATTRTAVPLGPRTKTRIRTTVITTAVRMIMIVIMIIGVFPTTLTVALVQCFSEEISNLTKGKINMGMEWKENKKTRKQREDREIGESI